VLIMTERLSEIVLGLQRLGENAVLRGKDIRYHQRQQDDEYLDYVRQLLTVVNKVRGALMEQEREFSPPVEQTPAQLKSNAPNPEALKFLQRKTGGEI
jgi:hypothetical protein